MMREINLRSTRKAGRILSRSPARRRRQCHKLAHRHSNPQRKQLVHAQARLHRRGNRGWRPVGADSAQDRHPAASVDGLLRYGQGQVPAAGLRLSREYALPDVLALALTSHARRAFSRGLLHGYRTEEEALYTVRGRIRFDEQIRRRFGIPLPVECATTSSPTTFWRTVW